MKKILLFASLFLVSILSNAQGALKLYDHDGHEILNGQNITVFVDDLGAAEVASDELFVKNNTDAEMSVKCVRTVVSEASGTMNYFCALGTCLAPMTDETPLPYKIAANTQVEADGAFSAHYMPMSKPGTTVLKYKFYNVDNDAEFIEFQVTFTDMSMELFADDVSVSNGHVFSVTLNDENGEIESPRVLVKNISDENINIKVRRDIIDEVEGSENYFCALGSCLSPDLDELTREYPLAAGTLVTDVDAFYAHYSPKGNNGTTKIRYKYFNMDDANDTISFEVHFDVFTGLNELDAAKINAYPNPAANLVQFSFDDLSLNNARLVIYNAVGKEALSTQVNNANTLNLDVSNLPKGVYLYRLEGESKMSKTSKLIIQ